MTCTYTGSAVLQMVNEQIGIENMKRRVDLEHRRQRAYSKLTRAMWAEHDECIRMEHDWTPRRAKWEALLKELHSLRGDKNVPRLDPNETPKPLGWGPHHWKGTVIDQKLPNDELYSLACARLATLEAAAGPPSSASSSSFEPGQAQAEVSEQPDWFKVHQSAQCSCRTCRAAKGQQSFKLLSVSMCVHMHQVSMALMIAGSNVCGITTACMSSSLQHVVHHYIPLNIEACRLQGTACSV